MMCATVARYEHDKESSKEGVMRDTGSCVREGVVALGFFLIFIAALVSVLFLAAYAVLIHFPALDIDLAAWLKGY